MLLSILKIFKVNLVSTSYNDIKCYKSTNSKSHNMLSQPLLQ